MTPSSGKTKVKDDDELNQLRELSKELKEYSKLAVVSFPDYIMDEFVGWFAQCLIEKGYSTRPAEKLEQDWEKEFDKRFGNFNAWADVGNPEKEHHTSPEEIKDFIRQLLFGQAKIVYPENPYDYFKFRQVYRQALEDVKRLNGGEK